MKLHSFLGLSIVTVLTGCASVKNIEIAPDASMASASVQVDVVQDSQTIQSVPVSQYFLPGNPVRNDAKPKTVRFGGGSATQTVSTGGFSKSVVVIAHLPGGHMDAAGDADARRETIPLSGSYKGQKVTPTMRVDVTAQGISVSPVKKK